jgi:DNA primase
MTVQLDWPPDVVDQLTEEARKKRLSLDLHQNGSNSTSSSEEQKRRQRAEAVAMIRELRTYVKPDPDGWTSRDYINFGRR